MKYISSDTNVWIDFYKISKTQLPFRMSCKYIMFHEAIEKELLYPKDLKSQLIDGGLLGVEITTEELFYADELSKKYRKVFDLIDMSFMATASKKKKEKIRGPKGANRPVDDCVRCGHCNSWCPFVVVQMNKMQEIKDYFGE